MFTSARQPWGGMPATTVRLTFHRRWATWCTMWWVPRDPGCRTAVSDVRSRRGRERTRRKDRILCPRSGAQNRDELEANGPKVLAAGLAGATIRHFRQQNEHLYIGKQRGTGASCWSDRRARGFYQRANASNWCRCPGTRGGVWSISPASMPPWMPPAHRQAGPQGRVELVDRSMVELAVQSRLPLPMETAIAHGDKSPKHICWELAARTKPALLRKN